MAKLFWTDLKKFIIFFRLHSEKSKLILFDVVFRIIIFINDILLQNVSKTMEFKTIKRKFFNRQTSSWHCFFQWFWIFYILYFILQIHCRCYFDWKELFINFMDIVILFSQNFVFQMNIQSPDLNTRPFLS